MPTLKHPRSRRRACITPAAPCTSAQRSYDSAARMSANELASYGYDAAGRITSLTQKLYSRPRNRLAKFD